MLTGADHFQEFLLNSITNPAAGAAGASAIISSEKEQAGGRKQARGAAAGTRNTPVVSRVAAPVSHATTRATPHGRPEAEPFPLSLAASTSP